MANPLNSSDSNQKLGIGVTNNINTNPSLSPSSSSNPTYAGLHRNEISIEGELVNGVRQLGLSLKVDELRKTLATPERVWIQGPSESLPLTTHSALPTGEVGAIETSRASEILRAQLLCASPIREHLSIPNEVGATEKYSRAREAPIAQLLYASSTRDRLPTPNDGITIPCPNLQNKGSPVQTRVDHPVTEDQQFHNTFNFQHLIFDYSNHSQNPICSPSHLSQQNQARFTIAGLDEPTNAQGNETFCPTPLTVCFPRGTRNPLIGNNLQNLNLRETIDKPNRNKQGAFDDHIDMVISDDEDDSEYDGRIYSSPYKKHGPYICSRCSKEFTTSQRFAAHASFDHYKYETQAQKKKRLLAKIRGRNLCLQQSRYGLTFVPVSSPKTSTNRYAAKFAQGRETPIVKIEVEDDLQGRDQVASLTKAVNDVGLTDVKIKVEPDA